MNKDIDCHYIIRYKEQFEQDENTFVVMDYMENGLYLLLFSVY
jgi:serine/threonine protein kinase